MRHLTIKVTIGLLHHRSILVMVVYYDQDQTSVCYLTCPQAMYIASCRPCTCFNMSLNSRHEPGASVTLGRAAHPRLRSTESHERCVPNSLQATSHAYCIHLLYTTCCMLYTHLDTVYRAKSKLDGSKTS